MPDQTVPPQTERLDKIASWFLGPRAENIRYLEKFYSLAADAQKTGRNSYFPHDPVAITPEMQSSSTFQEGMKKLDFVGEVFSEVFAQNHVPFWNPRYNAHMSMDTTLPSQIGYLISMTYNPNNVALEASPFTTAVEAYVGREHCQMIGINISDKDGDKDKVQPVGWGHITCDGSVANLESVWAARNLKFYPLSLVLAMDGPLSFTADTFKIPTCQGEEKLLKDFTTWELFNIRPDVVLDIPDRLYREYSISPQFLTTTMNDYLVQTVPRDDDMFNQRFGRENLNQMAYIVSATKHYSWPKAAAVTGIGSRNVLDITVDDGARMDMEDLRIHLDKCLAEKRAIYAVVAIIGSTEHGACDPLKDIVEIRKEYQTKGLSFVLHADGAWGSYFHSILNAPLPRNQNSDEETHLDANADILPGFPYTALKPKTRESLRHLRFCDSITIDPHKSGYIQYPAGGLLYRDGRMRYLVTWTSPVVFRGEAESMGVYGIEGSKPGAAPSAVFFSHTVLGLDSGGYGTLLAEGIYSCVKMYASLITMSTPDTDFRVRTLVKPPVEIFGHGDNPDLGLVRKLLNNRFHEDANGIQQAQFDNQECQLIEIMGSDLAINTFVVNFRVNGVINEDIVEANNLNTRIFNRCAIVRMNQDINKIPIILTSTVLKQEAYKKCLTHFKQRLGLVGDQDLYVLINVVTSPYPMMYNYTEMVMKDLRRIIEEEVEVSKMRNTITPTFHGFVLQGTERLYCTHLPMFNMADHRYQLIITGDLPQDVMQKYVQTRKDYPGQYFTLGNVEESVLEDMIAAGEFEAVIDRGLPPEDGSHFITGFKLTNIRIVKNARLDSKYLTRYPANNMPFYVYGETQLHIDHVLLASPNIQLNSDRITFKSLKLISSPESLVASNGDDQTVALSKIREAKSGDPYLLHFTRVPESAMQPFPDNQQIAAGSFFFKPNGEYEIVITEPGDVEMQKPWAKGVVQLSDTIFMDTDMLNENPAHTHGAADGGVGAVTLTSSFEHYSHKATVHKAQLPLFKKPDESEAKKWHKFVGALARGSEDYQKFVAEKLEG